MIVESIVVKEVWFKKTCPEPNIYQYFINNLEVSQEEYKSRFMNLSK